MGDKQQIRASHDMARRWQALAERRREHFADLYASGRWRKYYREHAFLAQMHETARMTAAWAEVVQPAGAVPGAR
jgi:uncharacterized repeat protein (TIGR03809 family)